MKDQDAFGASAMARTAIERLGSVAVVILGLWLAIAWAVSLP